MAQLTRVQIEKMQCMHIKAMDLLTGIKHYNDQYNNENNMKENKNQELIDFFLDEVNEREEKYAELMLQFQKFLHENIPA